MYSGYGIAFDGEGTCSFDSDYTKNVKTLGVDNSSSSHADNHKKSFLWKVKDCLMVLVESLVHQRKSLVLSSIK